ncbi:S26 family signal peptidase, partial [PVC group bacterium]|nr:S26 family signal peptidase [PVC group bacterium]
MRRIKKSAKELLRHTRHVRNMREDILGENELTRLATSEINLKQAVRSRDYELIKQSVEEHSENLQGIMPSGSSSSLIENLEVLVVAVAVAMAFRAYFVQPFKIPTGSMKPTLSGIYSRPLDEPGFTDKMPFKLIKFVFTGEWYTERRAKRSGVIVFDRPVRHPKDPSAYACIISGDVHKIQSDAANRNAITGELRFRHGEYVEKGDLLWSGVVTRGDHLFVNKVVWNFRKPRRGEIMVFTTTGISELE